MSDKREAARTRFLSWEVGWNTILWMATWP